MFPGDGAEPTRLTIRGDLDLATTPEFDRRVDESLAAGRTRVEVDMREVTFCDSMGLNALVRAKHRCEKHGGHLTVTGAEGQVAQVMEISGLVNSLRADR